MTEEEAKTKWCPFAQHADGNRIPYGSGTSGSTDTEDWKLFGDEMADMHPCIGSACMAWRWDETAVATHKRLANDGSIMGYALTDRFDKVDEMVRAAREGSCGLAGKP